MKKVGKKSSRIMIIDLMRIIFMGFIMMLHFLFIFGDDSSTIRVRSAYIFVEAFFIITGYFTVRHFKKSQKRSLDKVVEESLKYTFLKFKSFIPYVIIAVLIGFLGTFLYRDYTSTRIFLELGKLPVDFLYSTVFYNTGHCGPLWYLSAMFFVFPFFCILAQAKKYRNIRNLFCYTVAALFLLVGQNDTESFPALYRAFSSLVLGLIVYEGSEWLAKKKIEKKTRVFLQILEISIFGFILFCVLHHGDFIGAFAQIRFDVLLGFVIMFILIFSKATYTHKLNAPAVFSVAKLVLPVFLIHENIALIMYHLDLNLPFMANLIIYYITTIILSIVAYLFVEKIIAHKSFRHHTSDNRS